MTNREARAITAIRYPNETLAKAARKVKQEQRQIVAEMNAWAHAVEARRLEAETARIERDLDMAGIAQTPRRATRRRLNPFMVALVGGLLIGMKED